MCCSLVTKLTDLKDLYDGLYALRESGRNYSMDELIKELHFSKEELEEIYGE